MKANIGLYIQGVLAGILLFMLANPYYIWAYTSLGYLLRLVYGVVLVLNFRKEKNPVTVIWVFLLLFISIATGRSFISSSVFIFANVFLLTVRNDFIDVAYKSFYNIFVAFALLSIINYALVLLGVSLPSHIIEPLNDAKDYNYNAFPFMVMNNKLQEFYRFEGVFDEPGALATYCFMFLWAEKFELFKWRNIIILISGILSLSLFFFVAIGVVLLIKVFTKGANIWFRVAAIGLIALFAYSLTIEDSITSTVIGDRLEFDEEKGFKGNNRSTDYLDLYYDQVRWKESVFFWGPTISGVGKEKIEAETEGAAGYKSAILVNGLIGCAFYILFFLAYARKFIKKRKDFVLFALCFLMTLFQRPFFTEIVFIFMFVSIIRLHDYHPKEAEVKTIP